MQKANISDCPAVVSQVDGGRQTLGRRPSDTWTTAVRQSLEPATYMKTAHCLHFCSRNISCSQVLSKIGQTHILLFIMQMDTEKRANAKVLEIETSGFHSSH